MGKLLCWLGFHEKTDVYDQAGPPLVDGYWVNRQYCLRCNGWRDIRPKFIGDDCFDIHLLRDLS